MLVGTAGYLAPEQILGEPVDARADLFAFGAILYEMLTGRSAFGREHTIDTLHAVLREPAPSLREEPGVAPDMAAIAERLLEKDPAARFHSVADLAWTLERTGCRCHGRAVAGGTSQRAPLRWRAPVAIAAAVLILPPSGCVRGHRWHRARPQIRDAGGAQFTWRLPDEMRLASAPVVSPDGRHIAFVGVTDSRSGLWIRDLPSLDARAIPGTAGANQPFWSPDSRSLGFFANRKLLRVKLDSAAPPVALADAPDPCGGTWSPAGTIVFQPEIRESSLKRVAADGGHQEPATVFDVKSDVAHRWPAFLPDGVHFLYFVQSELDARRGIYVGSIAEPNAPPGRRLLAAESGATFVARADSDLGLLLTVRSSRIEARPFDARTLTFDGGVSRIALPVADTARPVSCVARRVGRCPGRTATPIPFGVRLVVMSTGGDAPRGDARGRARRVSASLARRPAARANGGGYGSRQRRFWVQDLDRGTQLRLTTGREVDVSPVWSPKGDRIAYRTGRGKTQLAIVNADGTGTPVTIDCPRLPCEPTDWSIDGRGLLVNAGADVWTVPVDARKPPAPLLSSAFIERDARYSPDGRWIAYVSDESGRVEVSMRTVTGPQRRIVVSNQGGDQPVWLADGSALFYVDHEHLLQRVSVHAGPDGGMMLGRPERVRVPAFPPAIGARPTMSRRTARASSCPSSAEEQAPRR